MPQVLLRFSSLRSIFRGRLMLLSVMAVSCAGCQSFSGINNQSLLPPSSEFGVHWNSPEAEYQAVRHVEPARVASREQKETAVERFDDVIANTFGTGPKIDRARQTFTAAERMYNQAVQLRQTANGNRDTLLRASELFVEAGALYLDAGNDWEDSALHEDAIYMASECYFYIDYYAQVVKLYRALLKKYPHTRHLATVQHKRFAIARYWVQADEKSPQGFFQFNLTNQSMPVNSRFDKAIAILNSIRDDDPTSDIADDATMLMADSYFKRNQMQKAHEVLTDLVKLFPSSEHQFLAHSMLLQAKLELYRGPEYSGVYLDDGEKLIRAIRRQFPDQSQKDVERWDRFSKQIRYLKAEREWWVAKFYEIKDEIGAARIYYRQIASEYHDTPFANRAFVRLNDLKNRPAKPGQPVKWLVDLFPEDDPVKHLIATESDGLLR